MKNVLYILLLFIVKLSVAQTTYYVNDNTASGDTYCSAFGNNSNDGLSAATPKATLTNVLDTYGPTGTNVLTTGDIIYVDAGMYYQTDANLTLNVDGISIIGAGSDLTVFDNDAASSDANRWANLTADDVTLEGLFITGYNYGVADAIALQINGAQDFTITDVRVNENLPGGGSSAIFITGSSTGSFSGGGASCNPPNPSVAGGGVNIQGNGNVISFNDYELSNNSKDLQGGAGMRIDGNSTTIVTITNSLFEANETDGSEGGGGILILNGAFLTITGSCFIGNNASQASSVNYGGAINVGEGADVTITDCSFDGNFATSSGNGGAISINSDLGTNGGAPIVRLNTCSFSNNSATDGNDLYTRGGNGESIIADECTWSSTASEELHVDQGTITTTNSGSPESTGAPGVTSDGVPASTTPTTSCPASGSPCYTVVLPVELFTFHGKCNENGNELTWQTASEYNNAYFIIERAGVEGQFELIEKLPGSLNSSDLLTYTYSDEEPKLGINYYRLSQVDVDGRSERFESITVHNNCTTDELTVVYMAKENLLYLPTPLEGVSSISLLNMAGQLVEHLTTDPRERISKLQLNDPPGVGVYLLKVDRGETVETGKVLITK